jgi:hypothetical protein
MLVFTVPQDGNGATIFWVLFAASQDGSVSNDFCCDM